MIDALCTPVPFYALIQLFFYMLLVLFISVAFALHGMKRTLREMHMRHCVNCGNPIPKGEGTHWAPENVWRCRMCADTKLRHNCEVCGKSLNVGPCVEIHKKHYCTDHIPARPW